MSFSAAPSPQYFLRQPSPEVCTVSGESHDVVQSRAVRVAVLCPPAVAEREVKMRLLDAISEELRRRRPWLQALGCARQPQGCQPQGCQPKGCQPKGGVLQAMAWAGSTMCGFTTHVRRRRAQEERTHDCEGRRRLAGGAEMP